MNNESGVNIVNKLSPRAKVRSGSIACQWNDNIADLKTKNREKWLDAFVCRRFFMGL
jgi:hypothetical protein